MRRNIIFISVLLAACGSSIPHLSPYKMDIRQGNFVTPEMREKLKLGMSKQQVRYVLGTPLVNDAFHGDRWDYAYSLMQRGKVVEQQAMTLTFAGDNLARIHDGISADEVAAVPSASVVSPLSNQTTEVETTPLAAPVVAVPELAKTDDVAAVKNSLQTWATAWSARDIKQYLATYGESFTPVALTRSAWQKQREQRINKARHIEVKLSEMKVVLQDQNHATASFKQDYRSDLHFYKTDKTLQLEKVAGAWLIVAETIEQ